MLDIESRVAALETAHAVSDERWKQVVERLDVAASSSKETQRSIYELGSSIQEMKVYSAHKQGAGVGVTALLNWTLTILTAAGTFGLALLEIFRVH